MTRFKNPDNQFVGATVEDDVFCLENMGMPVDEMHERVSLPKTVKWDYRDKEPAALSAVKTTGGDCGRDCYGTKIIILDESTSMLDPEGRDELMAIVADIKQDKALTVI